MYEYYKGEKNTVFCHSTNILGLIYYYFLISMSLFCVYP